MRKVKSEREVMIFHLRSLAWAVAIAFGVVFVIPLMILILVNL